MTNSNEATNPLDTSAAGGPHGGEPVAMVGAPPGEGDGAVIMIHGRNAAPQDILGLARALDRPRFTWVAPGAAGNTWYPHSFMAPTEANQPGLSSGLAVVGTLAKHLEAAGVPREKIMLLGFSQGACLTSEFAVRNPARYGGVIVYSGGLIGPPGTTWDTAAGSFRGTPVFLGCSDVDPHVPLERLEESARVFEEMGARVTKRIYPGMGHLVNDDEIATAREIMDRVAGG